MKSFYIWMPMKILRISSILLFLSVSGLAVNAQLVINEVVSRNESSLHDFEDDTPDWIELLNTGDEPFITDEIYLSDKLSDLEKWELPEIEILPGEFVIIYASGKNLFSPELHCNFKLDGEGESLYLYNENDNEYSFIAIPQLNINQAYGRFPDGGELVIEMDIASPGASNYMGNSISLSHDAGFYDDEFELFVFSKNLLDTVFYTLDGSLPTQESSYINSSLQIDDRSSDPNMVSMIPTTPSQDEITHKAWEEPAGLIPKATVVRFTSFRNGIRTSSVQTKSYFVEEGIQSKYNYPIVSLTSEMANLFDHDTGIYVPGVNFDESNSKWTGNYFMKGDDWERDVHVECFTQQGYLMFNQDAGMRINGVSSRQACQKSLRLYARKEYGSSHFEYPIFNNSNEDEYKRIILRSIMGAGQWDYSVIRDQVALALCDESSIELQNSFPVIVFLDGEYWGIHDLRERLDQYYISSEYDCQSDSVVIMGNWDCPGNQEDCQSFNELKTFIDENSLESESNYEWVKTQMDIDNFIDYFVCEIFLNNYDWPGNNVKAWKLKGEDSKWRWFMYDFDHAFRDWEYNSLIHASTEGTSWPFPAESTLFFRRLIENSEFVEQFKERMAFFMNTVFWTERTSSILQETVDLYDLEMEGHILRYDHPPNQTEWKDNVEIDIEDFLMGRPCEMWKHMESFFDFTSANYYCFSNLDSQFSIYPNPSDGFVSVYFSETDPLNGKISVLSIEGEIVKSFSVDEAQHSIGMNLQGLSAGMYLVRAKINGYPYSTKLIIQ